MKQELFDPQAFAESSSRIIYTPSTFARKSLFHLQEAGSFQAVYPHTSKRSDLVSSSDHIQDMRINEKLAALLTVLMEQSGHSEEGTERGKRLELSSIKAYLDEHYAEKIVLDDLAERFFINKFYMTKIFKATYGTTIINYLISKRITRAKQLLRFTDPTMDEISIEVGMDSANYFSRAFHKVEGISPSEYRKQW